MGRTRSIDSRRHRVGELKTKPAAALCAVAALALISCGPAGSRTASPSPTRAVSSAPNGWTISASTGPNDTVVVSVTVTGPLTVRSGCQPSVSGYLTRQDGTAVPTPVPGIRCMAITLIEVPAGASRTFTGTLQAPGHGDFLVHATLNVASGGSVAPLQVWVTV